MMSALVLSEWLYNLKPMLSDTRGLRAIGHAATVVMVVSEALLVLSGPAFSQTPPVAASPAERPATQAAPPASEPPAPSVAPRRENPGLINEIGKLLERNQPLFPSLAPLPSVLPSESPPPPATQAVPTDPPVTDSKDSGIAIPHLDLKIPSMQKGREKCPVAANGASDCKAAADALCRAHGYKEGKSSDTDATQKCSAEALLLSGRKSQPGACRTDYFVTRAWCQ